MPLDYVVDDASHLYRETKATFEVLFPRLRPGGVYVVEDWAWAHFPDDLWQVGGGWFHDRPALTNLVVELLLIVGTSNELISETPDMPFCLAWANENWSRHWDASAHEVLLRQRYSPEDDEEHGRFLLRALSHPLYLRVDGRPVLFIYRIQSLPDPNRTMARWREIWRGGGIDDVHIIKFDTDGDFTDPARFGVDASAQFVPHGTAESVPRICPPGSDPADLVLDYEDVVDHYISAERPSSLAMNAWSRIGTTVRDAEKVGALFSTAALLTSTSNGYQPSIGALPTTAWS